MGEFNIPFNFDEIMELDPKWIKRCFEQKRYQFVIRDFVGEQKIELMEKILNTRVDVFTNFCPETYNLLIEAILHVKHYHYDKKSKYNKERGNKMIRLLLENGGKNIINKVDKGYTPFTMACHNYNATSNIETIKILLEYGVDINEYGTIPDYPPLLAAIAAMRSVQDIEVVRMILNHKNLDINNIDIKNKDRSIIKFIIDRHLSFTTKIISLLLERNYKFTDDDIKACETHKEIQKLLLVYNVIEYKYYYGVVSKDKINITFPNIIEIQKEDKYYYVYLLETHNNMIAIPNNDQTGILVQLADIYKLDKPTIYKL